MNPQPADPILARLLAIEADIRMGGLDKAAAGLAAARKAAANDVRVALVEAILARAQKDIVKEIGSLRRAVQLAPGSPAAHVELAKALLRGDDHQAAISVINHASSLFPGHLGVLEVAVSISNVAGMLDNSERHLRAAKSLRPDDEMIHRALAVCLSTRKNHAEAATLWRETLTRFPNDPAALGNLGVSLLELGENEEAIVNLQRALDLMPTDENTAFFLAMAKGETPRTRPNDLTRKLFDSYSSRFDKHLVGQLKYRVPQRVAEIVRARHPNKNVDVLDLGCGTGLTGVYLGPVTGKFVGVDLAPQMIERAARHGVYTELRALDLRSALAQTQPQSFDYVIANDVFVYVGDLSDIFPAAFRALRAGGTFVFSCEALEDTGGDYVLRRSRRYAHSRAYVRNLCIGAGFDHCEVEDLNLREENNQSIPGFIVVARKV